VYIYIYTHICIYIYIHTYIHVILNRNWKQQFMDLHELWNPEEKRENEE
jgi:hypothetical protein